MKNKDYESLMRDAVSQIRDLKKELKLRKQSLNHPIAIIGMSGRFPGNCYVYDRSFWEFLKEGKNSVMEVPKERWDIQKYYNSDQSARGYTYCSYGSFLSNVKDFDAAFFGVSPREAIYIDPQHRFMMECAWEALEDANIPPKSLKGSKTGIFMAQSSDDYHQLLNTLERREKFDYYSGTGTSRSMLAGRLAYILGTHGPSLQLDTSCSSSLTAIHLAIQSLRTGECQLAIVGGVQLNLSPMGGILRSRTQALSPSGQCKAFSQNANGFVQGEGVGVIILTTLSNAESQHKRIHAIIRGSAINHDGASAGLTAPNEVAQIDVLRAALENSGVDYQEVSYIETHGTGTVLGDPIEINALNVVYGENRKDPVWVGSVKSNIGHLEAAAGIASIIKTVLALENKTIPPHLHFENLNSHINWASIPFKIPSEPMPWPIQDGEPCAGVSSFGMSGTNVHILLQSYTKPLEELSSENERSHIFTISAKSKNSLQTLAKRYRILLDNQKVSLENMCYTAATCRDHFKYRSSVVVSDICQLKEFLEKIAKGNAELPLEPLRISESLEFISLESLQENEKNCLEDLFKIFPSLKDIFEDSYRDMLSIKDESQRWRQAFKSTIFIFLNNLGFNEVPDLEKSTFAAKILRDPVLLLKELAKAYSLGRTINWLVLYEESKALPITLPPYAFNTNLFWPEDIVI